MELTYTSEQPTEVVPAWAERIPRWSQLDPASAAIVLAWHHWLDVGLLPRGFHPGCFILAAAEGSRRSDHAFARTGAFSPARFVSTLPSVMLSALFQVTGWVGPMYCVQCGAETLATARSEADVLSGAGKGPVCIISYEIRGAPSAAECQVDVLCTIVGPT